jgi:hypothetical protein
MKIRFYIITYDCNLILNEWLLESIKISHYDRNDVEFFIINNHTNLYMKDEYKSFVKVIDNNLRPDFSTGHLSRNYNQAIINGFEDLNNPKCDAVITCQVDSILCPYWHQEIIKYLESYKYICVGTGDQLQVFTPESVKEIGLYDERFCNIGFQEADYFLRSCIYFRKKSSINDFFHFRVLNSIDHEILFNTPSAFMRNEKSHMDSYVHHKYTKKLFKAKWGFEPEGWEIEPSFENVEPLIQNYIYYPYFEKNINNLSEKKYLV